MTRLSNRYLTLVLSGVLCAASGLWSVYLQAKPAFDAESRKSLSLEQKEVVLQNVDRLATLAGWMGWNRIEAAARGSGALVRIDIDRRPQAFDRAEADLQRSIKISVDTDQLVSVEAAYSRFQCVREGKVDCAF